MTAIDAMAAPAPSAEPDTGTVRFLGNARDYWRLLTRGAVLLMLTLGIYRFWLTTDMRRFLWANTDVAGDGLEYTGTPRELLIGFLVAVVVLVPINITLFVLLDLGPLAQMSAALGFLLLAFLGHFAVYRARRYRLTRTLFRSVRFHQTGSAWHYAICAMFWWVMIALTIGLAYPLAQSRLERFKLRNTHFGDLDGRFEGSGFRLFVRGFVMWLLVMGPFAFGLVKAVMAIDWVAFEQATRNASAEEIGAILLTDPTIHQAGVIALFAVGWALLASVVLYPAFQAMLWRWWASGLRFGEVEIRSRLRSGALYGVYLRFVLYIVLFSIAAAAVAAVAIGIGYAMFGAPATQIGEIVTAAAGVFFYVMVALGYSTIYQAVVRLRLWRLVVESLEISNMPALARVAAVGQPSSAFGEGLADALNVGGI